MPLMPKSRGRKKSKKGTRRRGPSPLSPLPSSVPHPAPPISELVEIVMRGDDALSEEDPFVVEMWASHMLGTFYKLPLPFQVRDEFERSLEASLLEAIDESEGENRLAILRALAAVAPAPIGPAAQARAVILSEEGVADPPWAHEIGRPEFVDAWMSEDPFGDQRGYFARFRYPGRAPHTVMGLYDVNLGGIVKDSFAVYTKRDLRSVPTREEMSYREIDPEAMAIEILAGIGTGDIYIDNDWTEDFRKTRALLAVRMSLLVDEEPRVLSAPDPVSDESRAELIEEFTRSEHATGLEAEDPILHHIMVFRCDYSDGDPLRWSPIAVELFMVDFLPRKATLDAIEIRNLPTVLKAWVEFALVKRGLERRWVDETQAAVDRWTTEFRKEVTNPDSFGPAKAIGQAMMADGIDITDRRSVDGWMEEFNRRPSEERGEFPRDR